MNLEVKIEKLRGLTIPDNYADAIKELKRVHATAISLMEQNQRNCSLLKKAKAAMFELKAQRVATEAWCKKLGHMKSNCDALEVDIYLRLSIGCLCIFTAQQGDFIPVGAIGVVREIEFWNLMVEYNGEFHQVIFGEVRILHEISTYEKGTAKFLWEKE